LKEKEGEIKIQKKKQMIVYFSVSSTRNQKNAVDRIAVAANNHP
jgi:hypothetical protein